MRMKITTAGRAKLVNDPNTGTNTVLISHIGLTATGFTPTAAMTQLPGEFKRMTSFGGKSVAADTIHVTLQDSGTEKYTLRGFGLYLSDGTLFAVYGQADAIMEKASISTLLLSADVVFADIDTAQITFGSTEFLNPPATTEVAGVLELATETETATGTDTTRGVTPRGLKSTLDGRFGTGAPTAFVKTLLALATAAAIRTKLELKGAALIDPGHGKGLDADMLDGMHASDFPQFGQVQLSDTIAVNNAQVRWIKLGTLPWTGNAASILLFELTNGGISTPRYVWEQVAVSTRSFGDSIDALTQAHVDGMIFQSRIGFVEALGRHSRIGLTLNRDSAGKSTGVTLWLQQREYSYGHTLRVVNCAGATYLGVKTYVTVEPAGILYATAQPVAYVGDLRKLVDSTENRWGRRQTFALGMSLPSDQTVELGSAGGTLRGTAAGSVVLGAGAGAAAGFIYLRPNGTASTAGQVVIPNNGFVEMTGARIGAGSGDGRVLCELYSERSWQFKQAGSAGSTALELHDSTGGKELRLTNVSNASRIVLNPTGSWINATEFRGKLTGNADSATKLAVSRTINGVAFNGSANIVTSTWGAQRTIRIGNTAKAVNGGADVTWSLTEIGAAGLAHQHSIGDVQGLEAALDAKGNWYGEIAKKTYDEHLPRTAFGAAFHSAGNCPSDAPIATQHNVLHFGSTWGRAQIALPNDQARMFFRSGVRTSWLEAWHSGNFDPNHKATRIPGQVIMFAGKSAPSGTLLCNGAAVSRTTYAALFAAIGTIYGAGDGKTTFNLPSMVEGTVVTHTQTANSVGTTTNGEVIRHAHTASSASAGAHSHTITVAGGGTHSHSASAAAAGDHVHGAWTDQQGHHGHTGGTSASGDHQHLTAYAESGAQYPWGADYANHMGSRGNIDYDNPWPYTSPAGNHAHSFTTDGAGGHGHNIGMNHAGNHAHTISVAQVGDHGHGATSASAGAHTHTVTVASTGGDRNLPAGLRMIYCITH